MAPTALHPLQSGIKVIPYVLEKGYHNIALVFLHGLGDTMMFRSVFDELKSALPDVNITLFLIGTQEPLIDGSKAWTGFDCLDGFEAAFVIDFPLVEGGEWTKPGLCAYSEMGLPNQPYPLKPFKLPLNKQAAVHFHGTCSPGATNPSETTAKQIYEILKSESYLPIDVHFEHCFHNPVNVRYPWFETTVRGNPPTIEKMYSVIANSHWFIGVTSGPLMMALAIDPDKVIALQGAYDLRHYTDQKVRIIDLNKFDANLFRSYLKER